MARLALPHPLLLLLLLTAAALAQSSTDSTGTTNPPSSEPTSSTTPLSSTSDLTTNTPSPSANTTPSPSANTTPSPSANTTPSPSANTTPSPLPVTDAPTAASSAQTATSSTPSPVPSTTPSTTPTSSITLRFVNDLRYHLHPVAAGDSACLPKDAGTDSCRGGLRCLLTEKNKAAAKEVWINAGVSLGYGDDLDAANLYSLLHHEPAARALKQLGFDAMSVDGDLFRTGKAAAARHMAVVGAGSFVCANCPGSLNVSQFKTVDFSDSCKVAVIGVINQSKAESKYLYGEVVADEVKSVEAAVDAIKKSGAVKALHVVVGEISEATAKAILADVPDVDVVLYSGSNVTDLALFKHEDGPRVAATLPSAALGKDYMKVGRLEVTVDGACKATGTTTATAVSYDGEQSKCAANEEATKVVTEVLQTVAAVSQSLLVKPVVALSGSVCRDVSCALGQMVADGVRAADAQGRVWEAVSRVVVVPAGELQGALAAGAEVTEDDVRKLFVNNPLVCRVRVKGSELWSAMQGALAGADTFPQVSGMYLDVVWVPSDGGDSANGTNSTSVTGLQLQRLWAVNANLSMTPVQPDDDVELNAPCQFLDRFHIANQTTGTTQLSDGLRWFLRPKDPAATATVSFVPPQVEERVRAYFSLPSRADLCEDWVGMTVAYTLLVLGSLLMVSYQGYQFWRFRSALGYVR